MIPLTKKKRKCIVDRKKCYICIKKYHKVKDHCHYTGKYRGGNHDICNLRYKISKEISLVFYNGSTYDYNERASRRI